MSGKFTEPISVLKDDEGDYRPNPERHHGFPGNIHDDDGIALDQYFEGMNDGPQDYSGAIGATANPKHVTRLLTRTLPLDGSQPQQYFPADPDRISLTIVFAGDATPVTAAEQVSIASRKGDTYGNGFISLPILSGNGFSLDGYTGEIWLFAQNLVATRNITVISHTR